MKNLKQERDCGYAVLIDWVSRLSNLVYTVIWFKWDIYCSRLFPAIAS